ncbi:MAG: glycosyltransferase [Bacteroidales bacterium]|nr:glycosyltransferase [Bacteroidales bacterium]
MNWLILTLLPYLAFFMTVWIRMQGNSGRVSAGGEKALNEKLFLSVLIPVRNEAGNIRNLLSALAAQSLDSSLFEIIIIDDGSIDESSGILLSPAPADPAYKLIQTEGLGKKKALALGMEQSRGNYIVSTDGDCRVHADWLKNIYSLILEERPDMIIGPVDIINTGSLLNSLVQLEFLSLQAVTEVFARRGRPVLCNGANLCFSNPGAGAYKEMVKEHINTGDDIFLMESFKRQGKIIAWTDLPGSMVYTLGPDTVGEFLRQRIRWSSKSISYTDPALAAISALVFLTGMVISLSVMAAIIIPALWLLPGLMYMIKSIPDILILSTMASGRDKKRLLYLFIPAQLLYPFYILAAGLGGIVKGLFSLRQDK